MATALRDTARLQRLIEGRKPSAQPADLPLLLPLRMAGADVGYVAPAVARQLAQGCRGFILERDALVVHDGGDTFDERSAFLERAALFLREVGLLRGWRNELLAVRAGTGPAAIAAIERAACRPLGITTSAVHLNAYADAATLIVARRADHKSIDPGLWDNLVGGMVPNGETVADALAREAMEEAGLDLAGIALRPGRKLHVRRPVPEGFQSEIIHIFDATLGHAMPFANQDGEVSTIDRRSVEAVIGGIERGEFTLEAALVTLESLSREAEIPTPPGLYLY